MALKILENGIEINSRGDVDYAWFTLDRDGEILNRAIVLSELASLPEMNRAGEQFSFLGRQWGALRGLYNAGVNFVFTVAGIYHPEHIGIIQWFGATGEGSSKKLAAERALESSAAVIANLANFPQSTTRSPDPRWLGWYFDFLENHCDKILAILGHPDPRENIRPLDKDGNEQDDLATEGSEMLFRGLAKLQKDFVFQVTAQHVARNKLTEALVKVAQTTSSVASRRRGSLNFGFSFGIPLMASLSQSLAQTYGVGRGESVGVAQGAAHSWGQGHANSVADGHTEGSTHAVSDGIAVSQGHSESSFSSESNSQVTTNSQGQSSSWGHTESSSQGVSAGFSAGVTGSYSYNWGSADSVGGSTSSGVAVSQGQTTSHGQASSDSIVVTQSHSETNATFQSDSHIEGEAWSQQEGYGESYVEARGQAVNQSRGSSQGYVGGLSTGLYPSISLGRSFQTEDRVADIVTGILDQLNGLLNQASREGAFMTDARLFVEGADTAAAAEALIPQAYHGEGSYVATPVMTARPYGAPLEILRTHGIGFAPYLDTVPTDPFDGHLWHIFSTLLTPQQLAAYTTPSVFREGTTAVVARIPDEMDFYPDMQGDLILGHQFSPQTSDLTTALVRLDKPRLMHTVFSGNTGYGKTVAAERMALEMSSRWDMRIVVLDFGFAWRKMLNAPELAGKVDVVQLRPDGVRPLRWNPLQIGRYINPELQLKATVDIFGTVAQLGQRQQQHRFLDALRNCYLAAGVLVDDPDIRDHNKWGKVASQTEAELISSKKGTPLDQLTRDQRQLLAVERSKAVSLTMLYEHIDEEFKAAIKRRDQVAQNVLEGIKWRLTSLVNGAPARQFDAGEDSIAIEDLGRPNGFVVIEGGKGLDNFSKAWLLGWSGWRIYADMVARRERQLNKGEADLFMVFEEANIIFSGTDTRAEDQQGQTVSEQFDNMVRDARKYGVFFGFITQTPSALPAGVLDSCSNVIAAYTTRPDDKQALLSKLARSEVGFHDEHWRRFLSDMAIGQVIGRLPYSFDRRMSRPFLFNPLIVNVPEPDDQEIEEKLGRISL